MNKAMRLRRAACCLIGLVTLPALVLAQEPGYTHNADELAKQLSNPVASLISVPLQLNFDDGYAAGGSRLYLNAQPVIPVSISDNWNMISRTILPIVSQDDIAPGSGSQFGLGDTTQSLFFSPKKPTAGGWILAIGPAFLVPTATDDLLGTGKWGAGPTALALKQTPTGWTYGALVNHIWSVAGDDDRNDISSTFLQPFLAKAIGQGRTMTVNIESTYDWEGEQWTIPVNFMYSKVTKFGSQMVSYAAGVRVYADAPPGGPDWGLRFVLTLLYPK